MNANNFTEDTLSHTYNTQRYNTTTIFTREKLYISEKLEDSVKDLTIRNPKYYESSTVTTSDT